MNQKRCRAREQYMGTLPSRAPLANGYVPMQSDNPPRYEPAKALIRGTLYPGLDLPFKGMVNNREKPDTQKTQIQKSGFVLQELALYLDTHPEDKDALAMYRHYQNLYHDGTKEFSHQCMPLSHAIPVDDKEYSWLRDPWPWEYAANKEG